MKARTMVLAALALGLAGSACQPPAQETGGLSEKDVVAIRNVLDSIIEADLAGDWAAAAAFATEDFVYMGANQPIIEGKAGWQTHVESYNVSFIDLSVTQVEIDGRDDLAYLRGAYSQTFTLGDSTEPTEDIGKFLWILRKQPDGSWLLALSISNSDLPLPGESSET